jgi:RimJ/RimL family protein N-acetyltransferase
METERTTLATERTTLTLLQESDLPAMTAMAREPDTFRYIRKLQVMTEVEYQQFLLLKLEQIRLKTGYHWAVWLKAGGAGGGESIFAGGGDFIGAVNLNPIGNSQRLQIGCQLKRAYWGQGFASELTKKVLEFALNEAGLTEVYGVFEKDNIISRRLLATLGFACIEKKTEQGVEIEVHRYPPVGLP